MYIHMFRAYYQLLNLSMIDNIMRTNSFQSHHIAKMHQKLFVINVKPESCSRIQEKKKILFPRQILKKKNFSCPIM